MVETLIKPRIENPDRATSYQVSAQNRERRQQRACLLAEELSYAPKYGNLLPYEITGERKWVIRKGQPWPVRLVDGAYPYAVLEDGELRLGVLPVPHGKIHHPELTNGRDVVAAGMISIDNRSVVMLSNESGHYRPEADSINYALVALRFWQVPLARRLVISMVWGS